MHFAVAQLAHWGARLLRAAGDVGAQKLNAVGRRLARPRCVYPKCSREVANWTVGEYCPIDVDLCEDHLHEYQRTVKDAPEVPVDGPDSSKHIRAWARWYKGRV